MEHSQQPKVQGGEKKKEKDKTPPQCHTTQQSAIPGHERPQH